MRILLKEGSRMEEIKEINFPKFQLGTALMFDGLECEGYVRKLANHVLAAIYDRDEPMFLISSGRLCRLAGVHTQRAIKALYQKTMFVF